MKQNELILNIPTGKKYITDWKDVYGNPAIDPYIREGRVVVNKETTGCGFTTYCITNDADTIIVSPRVQLIKNKVNFFNNIDPFWCYYYDRDKKDGWLSNKLTEYVYDRSQEGKSLKLFVTVDSFVKFANVLEQEFKYDLNQFRIVVDESHCLITDVKLKDKCEEPVIPMCLDRLFTYNNLLFISATPLIDFFGRIRQFIDNPWNYLILDWADKTTIAYKRYSCSGPLSAFDKIYNNYISDTPMKPAGAFDVAYKEDGTLATSTQATIFLNSIRQIVKILDEYVNKQHLIDVNDVTVICSDRTENTERLHDIPGLKISDIPCKGDRHKTWTFVTSRAYEGCDFYSPCASTYVIANYRTESLAIDISKDLHQIAGRQRLEENLFRDKMTIYYTRKTAMTDEEFNQMQAIRMNESNVQLALINATSVPELQLTALKNLKKVIKSDPNNLYVRFYNGMPMIDESLLLAEEYGLHVFRTQEDIKILNKNATVPPSPVEKLKNALFHLNSLPDRLRKVHDFLKLFPVLSGEVFQMLSKWNYHDIAYYLTNLPIDRLSACGYDPWKLGNEINTIALKDKVALEIMKRVIPGQRYSSKDIKVILNNVYRQLGISQKASATDIRNYVQSHSIKTGGKIVYIID